MSYIQISDATYTEFKNFLDSNDVKDGYIRINLAGYACSGPAFNITVDEQRDGDVLEKVNDVTFLMTQNLIDTFEGFKFTGTEENGKGLSLEPLKYEGGSGCSGCGGGCGH